MPIIVHDLKRLHKIQIKSGNEVVTISVKQLTYEERSRILAVTTKMQQGKVVIDYAQSCFLYLKYSLRELSGIVDEEGNEFKLVFENDTDYVSDMCIEQLLASDISDEFMYIADALSKKGYLKKIVDPMTNKPIENVEIITEKKQLKKK